jgi:hypothetical protein
VVFAGPVIAGAACDHDEALAAAVVSPTDKDVFGMVDLRPHTGSPQSVKRLA